MLSIVCLAVCVAVCTAYPSYQTLIPNGDSVPNPCGTGTWPGVGHLLTRGTGKLNPFGQDFAAAGHQWTKELCMKDSDHDGVSNGAELGDPHCHWTPVNGRHIATATGHPGICNPVGNCPNDAFKC